LYYATQISANSAFSDLPEHLLVDIYRELLVRIGGFSASTTGALVTQENKYDHTDELLDFNDDLLISSSTILITSTRSGKATHHSTLHAAFRAWSSPSGGFCKTVPSTHSGASFF
jgi:putative AlgH/UPF0301 family transcriptional regulator